MVQYSELPGSTIERPRWIGCGITVTDVRGEYEPFPWCATSLTDSWAVVLPRAGMYRRRYDGLEHIVDVNTGFVRRPGEEVAMEMPIDQPDELTHIQLDEEVVDGLEALHGARGPLRITADVELAHRLLRGRLAVAGDGFAIETAVADVLNAVVERPLHRPSFARPSTEAAHRRLVTDTCELLHVADPALSLTELARALAVSPFHLTKVFRRVTGETISQYRARLRVHQVLERVSGGEDNLSLIAATTGFADHSHMTRTVVAHIGRTPSALRRLLRSSA